MEWKGLRIREARYLSYQPLSLLGSRNSLIKSLSILSVSIYRYRYNSMGYLRYDFSIFRDKNARIKMLQFLHIKIVTRSWNNFNFKASSIQCNPVQEFVACDEQRSFAREFWFNSVAIAASRKDFCQIGTSERTIPRTMLPKEGTAKNQLEYTHKWS